MTSSRDVIALCLRHRIGCALYTPSVSMLGVVLVAKAIIFNIVNVTTSTCGQHREPTGRLPGVCLHGKKQSARQGCHLQHGTIRHMEGSFLFINDAIIYFLFTGRFRNVKESVATLLSDELTNMLLWLSCDISCHYRTV